MYHTFQQLPCLVSIYVRQNVRESYCRVSLSWRIGWIDVAVVMPELKKPIVAAKALSCTDEGQHKKSENFCRRCSLSWLDISPIVYWFQKSWSHISSKLMEWPGPSSETYMDIIKLLLIYSLWFHFICCGNGIWLSVFQLLGTWK